MCRREIMTCCIDFNNNNHVFEQCLFQQTLFFFSRIWGTQSQEIQTYQKMSSKFWITQPTSFTFFSSQLAYLHSFPSGIDELTSNLSVKSTFFKALLVCYKHYDWIIVEYQKINQNLIF